MQNNTRTLKSILNVKVALIFYFFNLLLQFFSRKVFLDYLGSEVLGLNTTAQNLLGFLNLAELGIGVTVAYSLYKPLYNEDHKVINDIVSIQGWLYRQIAYIVIIGAIILMLFFPLIFEKAGIPLWYAYGSFIAFLISSLLGYFINYKQVVLSADQKQYIITYSLQGTNFIKIILQILAIRFLADGYVWWLIFEVIMAIMASYVLNRNIRKEYPWLVSLPQRGKEVKQTYPDIIKKTKQIFFHQISGYVLNQTSPFVIYAYSSLTLVAIYGNYMLIVAGVTSLLNSLLNGVSAGIGNLVAEGNKNKIKSVYWEITLLRMWIASIICFGMYKLGNSFIALWVGGEYILPNDAYIILIAITFINLSRTNEAFNVAYGLFQDIWAPIVEAVLNLGGSILLGYYFGLPGILLGVFISLFIIVGMWKPYFLYSRGFKDSIIEYIIRYVKYIAILLIVFFISDIIVQTLGLKSYSISQWIINSSITILIYSLLSFVFLYIIDRTTKNVIARLIMILRKKIN